MATTIVAPIAPTQAVANAQGSIDTLLTQVSGIQTQLEADIASVAAGWQTLSAADQTAIMGRVLNGLGEMMGAVMNHMVVTNTIPPTA